MRKNKWGEIRVKHWGEFSAVGLGNVTYHCGFVANFIYSFGKNLKEVGKLGSDIVGNVGMNFIETVGLVMSQSIVDVLHSSFKALGKT